MTADVIRYAEETPLAEMGEVLEIIARRLQKYRQAHNGCVPREIFFQTLGLGGTGTYWCHELVIEVWARDAFVGYALRLREGDEDYSGLYHIVGVVHRTTDGFSDCLDRLAKEVFGKDATWNDIGTAHYMGFPIHREPDRYDALCGSHVRIMRTTADALSCFVGTWRIFPDINDRRIIDHHQNTLRWLQKPNPEPFADLR